MGGTIDVESEFGVGSTFTVRFTLEPPLTPVSAHSGADDTTDTVGLEMAALEVELERAVIQEPTSSLRVEGNAFEATVLVVEDNRDVRTYVKDHLSKRYRVIEAANGTKGMQRALDDSPDLVISDVMMPGINGFELCRRLKSNAKRRHVPVILLTARVETEDRIYGLELGADDYLAKPFSTRELEVRVANLLLSRRMLQEQFSQELWVKPAQIAIQPEEEAFMAKVLETMNRHLGDASFNTDMLADIVALSRRQVERRIKQITGHTPPGLVRKLRLDRAADILREAPGSISEVAYAVGFKSTSHFTVAFKKGFGVTPSNFAKEGPPNT
jgi:DNA-binding response OmpR family regulator